VGCTRRLSGEEIDTLFRTLDWQELLRDRAPRRDLVFRRKQDDRGILAARAGFSPGEGVVLPLGLVQGQKITQLLRNATLRVADVQDFDRLPIPFRALATDLESGEPWCCAPATSRRYCGRACPRRVCSPGRDRRAVAVDGGLWTTCRESRREMGVDVLIAVDVSFPLADARASSPRSTSPTR